MCTFFNIRKPHRSEKKHTRKNLTPATTYSILKDNIPEITIHDSIKTNFNYFTPEYLKDIRNAQKFSEMVARFFASKVEGVAPYTLDEWKEILEDNDNKERNQKKIYSSLYHGYPQELRREILLYLAETERVKQSYQSKGIKYEDLKAKECEDEAGIKKDIVRSFGDHEFFQENRLEKITTIHNILRAYANLDPEVGYTQGMNFVAGMLLVFLQSEQIHEEEIEGREAPYEQIELEEETFWVLVYIMQEKDWRMSYVDDTPRLQQMLTKLEDMVSEKLPNVHKLLVEHNCLPACFAQHFLTIMIFYCPSALGKKILEAFLVVGEEILLHVLIETLIISEKTILEKQEIEDLYSYLRNSLLKSI